MNNCAAKRCESYDELCAGGPGGFWIEREKNMFWCKLPCDEGLLTRLRIGGEEHPRWTLSGTDDKPTLSPSIDAVGKWHGYLTEGRFMAC